MNHRDDHLPPFDDGAREQEWLAQERAMHRERQQLESAGDDARSGRYRLLARVLCQPPAASLPADFAQHVAARVTATPARHRTMEAHFESVLTLALGLALLIATVVAAALYGSTWLPPFDALLSVARATTANGWLLALSGCVGASWLLGQWQPGAKAHTPHRPS